MKIESERKLLTVREVSEILNLKPRTIYNCTGLKAKRKFPVKPLRIGKSIRFDMNDIDKYIESLKS
jgi:predicted DNA-binding transcriptional regulator AlpA